MGIMAEIADLSGSFFARFAGAKGSCNNLRAKGIGGTTETTESFQHHGFSSSPPKGSRLISLAIGRGRRHVVTIAEHDYRVTVEVAYGCTTIYSTSADGSVVKARVELDSAGKIRLANETKSLKTVLDSLIGHLSGLTTIPAVSGTPLTLNPSVISQLATDSADLALLLKD